MVDSSFSIASNWTSDHLRAPEIGDRFVTMLGRLERLGPPMDNWLLIDPPVQRYVTLAEVSPDTTGWVERNIARDDDEEPDPSSGYRLLGKGSKIPSEYRASDSVRMNVIVGARWRNLLELDFGS